MTPCGAGPLLGSARSVVVQKEAVIPAGHAGTREVQGLLKVLSSAWLLDQLASLPGYDPARCGEQIAELPPRPQRAPRTLARRSGQPRPDHRK
jgi:hypothetical protein